MLFTVIIPLYNKAPYVAATVHSVLAQHEQDFEIVVVDDGSTDGGIEVVRQIEDPRIRLITQANAGVSAARNTAIKAAQGDWLAFLDADDWYHPDYLATLRQLIDTHPGMHAVATRYRSVPLQPGQALQTWDTPPPADIEVITNLPRRWMMGSTFFTASIAVRRAAMLQLTPWFPVGESYGEDLDVWFRIAEQGPIVLSHRPLVARVMLADGLSVTHRTVNEPPFLIRMERRARQGQPTTDYAAASLAFIQQARISLARSALEAGDRHAATRLLWNSRRAAANLRWIVTLCLTLAAPARAVSWWYTGRKRRGAIV